MHETHGGHHVIKTRLAGGRNPAEGRLPLYKHICNHYTQLQVVIPEIEMRIYIL